MNLKDKAMEIIKEKFIYVCVGVFLFIVLIFVALFFLVIEPSVSVSEIISGQETKEDDVTSVSEIPEVRQERSNVPTQLSTVLIGEIPGLNVVIADATPQSAVMSIYNNTDGIIAYGTYFYLEKLMGNDWFVYPEMEEKLMSETENWTSYAITLSSNEIVNEDLLWGDFYYGTLPDGSYRVIKEFRQGTSDEAVSTNIAAYFNLQNGIFQPINADLPYDSPYVIYTEYADLDNDGREEEITASYYHEIRAALLSNQVMGTDYVHMMLSVDNSEIAGFENDFMDELDIVPFGDGYIIITYESDTVGNRAFDIFTYNGLKVSFAGKIPGAFISCEKGIITSNNVFEGEIITGEQRFWTMDADGKVVEVYN